MKVKEMLGLLSYGTSYEVKGAYSGRIYITDGSRNETKEKYFEREVTDYPFYTRLKVDIDGKYCRPIVGIWMHDYDLAKEKKDEQRH